MNILSFFKHVEKDLNERYDSHSKSYYGTVFAMALESHSWSLRNSQNCPKMIKKPFLDVFQISQNCPYDCNKISPPIPHLTTVLYGQWHQNRMTVI